MKTFFLNRRIKKLNRKILEIEQKIAGNLTRIEFWSSKTTSNDLGTSRLPERVCKAIVDAKVENAQVAVELVALKNEKIDLMRQLVSHLKIQELADRARFP